MRSLFATGLSLPSVTYHGMMVDYLLLVPAVVVALAVGLAISAWRLGRLVDRVFAALTVAISTPTILVFLAIGDQCLW